jgi:hypothetical protein
VNDEGALDVAVKAETGASAPPRPLVSTPLGGDRRLVCHRLVPVDVAFLDGVADADVSGLPASPASLGTIGSASINCMNENSLISRHDGLDAALAI